MVSSTPCGKPCPTSGERKTSWRGDRGTFDFFARYKHYDVPADVLAMKPIPVEQLRKEGKLLTVNQWMTRIILLESFAGCPGMVAGTLRHLRSLRLLVGLPALVLVWFIYRGCWYDRGEMVDGSTRCWKKLRMSGCTSCKLLPVSTKILRSQYS